MGRAFHLVVETERRFSTLPTPYHERSLGRFKKSEVLERL